MAVKILDVFEVSSGDFHAIKELDEGDIPLVSCGDTDNGVVGYYAIPREKQYRNALTVAYNGSWPIMSKFYPYVFGAKDDVAVLTPRAQMSARALLYVAALLNRMTWRYSYGRKCFREKLEQVELNLPVKQENGVVFVDETAIAAVYPHDLRAVVGEITGDIRKTMSMRASGRRIRRTAR